jgi:hypothetical protein
MGTEVVFFYSEEGSEPDIVADLTFNKKDFTSYEAFQSWLGERMPEYVFLSDRPEVNSLDFDDLIDICTTNFPDLEYQDGQETEPEPEEPEENKQKQMQPEKLKEVVKPEIPKEEE